MQILSKIDQMQPINGENTVKTQLREITLETITSMMKELRLSGMKEEFQRFATDADFLKLGLREQLYHLLNTEILKRHNNRYKRRLKEGGLSSSATVVTIMEHQAFYRLDASVIEMLMDCKWRFEGKVLLIYGKSGLGKTDLGSAILDSGARMGLKIKAIDHHLAMIDLCGAYNTNVNEYTKILSVYTGNDLLFLDDGFIGNRLVNEPSVLKDLVDQCKQNNCGLILASQVNPKIWHSYLGSNELADAVMDRILEKSMLIGVSGKSKRSSKAEHLNEEMEDENVTK